MERDRLLCIHLSRFRQDEFLAGRGGIFAKVAQAADAAGWRVELRDEEEPATGPGYHLLHSREVVEPFSLNLRRAYLEPFWRIEDSNDRWNWQVAGRKFAARNAPADAPAFLNHWRGKLFGETPVSRQSFIFMPLQGKLLVRRHFQAMSPVEMIAATLRAMPDRQIFATLHPRESYSSAELDVLRAIATKDSRFVLSDRPSIELLAGCDFVVTQNSSLALTGFFARKPAVLFARIDFHHIAASVPDMGVWAAFAAVSRRPPPFGAYVHWFFKENALPAWGDGAEPRIRARFREHGWPM